MLQYNGKPRKANTRVGGGDKMASARLGRGGRRGKASDILLMEPIIVRGLDNAGKGIRGRVFPTASNGAYDKKKNTSLVSKCGHLFETLLASMPQ